MTVDNFLPNAGDSIIVRLKIDRHDQTLAKVSEFLNRCPVVLKDLTDMEN